VVNQLSVCNTHIESCIVQVKLNKFLLYVVTIYRPHSSSIENFTEKLIELLLSDVLKGKNVVLLGDFNINLLNQNINCISHFTNSLQCLNFLPLITKPTRFPSETLNSEPSLIDHIWTNIMEHFSSGIIPADITDHCITFMHLLLHETKSSQVKLTFRCHSDANHKIFNDVLSCVDWSSLLIGEIDNQIEIFDGIVNELYCECFPVKTKYVQQKRLQMPWLTKVILISIKRKAKNFCQLKLGLISAMQYKNYNNFLKSIIRNSKISYFNNVFHSCTNDAKKT
jgi:hypothetical protein